MGPLGESCEHNWTDEMLSAPLISSFQRWKKWYKVKIAQNCLQVNKAADDLI